MTAKRVLRWFFSHLIKGFVVLLPILGTIAIGFWLFNIFESILGAPLKWGLGTGEPEAKGPWRYIRYYPGMGTLLSLVIIFFMGMFIDVWWVKGVWNWMEGLLDRVPLVKSIYGSFRDLIGFFSSKQRTSASQVVIVKLGGSGVEVMGLITREDTTDLPDGFGGEGVVAVYLPFSYAMGGFTIMVQRTDVRRLDMTVEEAMRFAITAGMAAKETETAQNTES
ncbi:MAG: DUF502 domain-containing protein [Planctomycetes bacterium]|nr:DUF502 domain-containing protein [Planctomycetota bacterium]